MRRKHLIWPILLLACGCLVTVPDDEGRPCLAGECLEGYACHEGACITAGTGSFPPPVCSEGMCLVPEGSFLRGAPEGAGSDDESPAGAVTLSEYWIDIVPVTVAEYEGCVEDGECDEPDVGPYCNWRTARADHPVNCVSSFDARTYCHFAGKRLPTEAEWEKAARGTDGRRYPWGQEEPSCATAVWNEEGEGFALTGGCGRGATWRVGAKGAGESPYGALDMAGNVMEWVADWYDSTYYARGPAKDPPGPAEGDGRVARGGSWQSSDPEELRAAGRANFDWRARLADVGFRCAR